MLLVSGDEELGLGRNSTFKDAVVVILGRDDLNPLCGPDKLGKGAHCTDPIVDFLFGQAEFLPQNTVKLGHRMNSEIKSSISPLRMRDRI